MRRATSRSGSEPPTVAVEAARLVIRSGVLFGAHCSIMLYEFQFLYFPNDVAKELLEPLEVQSHEL